MSNSYTRKLALSGWLMEHGREEYESSLKLQKFLLLYESFSKFNGGKADFENLKGYKRGPVFSKVWGEYTHRRNKFDKEAKEAYSAYKNSINTDYAKQGKFVVSVLSEKELSDLTHKMNLWKSKEERIMRGERHVELSENDFGQDDLNLIGILDRMYPITLIDNSHIIRMNQYSFVFKKDDIPRITEQHFDTMWMLVENGALVNPVYVEIEEEGRLVVD